MLAGALLPGYLPPPGERLQNLSNEEEGLDLSATCSRFKDKVGVVLELHPVEARPRRSVLHPDKQSPNPRLPMRTVLALDVSHSMAEPYAPGDPASKLEHVKVFAQLVTEALGDEDYLGVVTFGTTARQQLPLVKLHQAEARQQASAAIDNIQLAGVTNIGAGLGLAVQQFKSSFTKSRFFNDNIILFTDGMANEGITETDELVREIRKQMAQLREECRFDSDYTVKLTALGTGGFLPELLVDLSRAFGTDAYYFLDDVNNMELNLMRPILLRQSSILSCLTVTVRALNGVLIDHSQTAVDYTIYDHEHQPPSDHKIVYFIADMPSELCRHLPVGLIFPKKHKKLLKGKDVLSIVAYYRDSTLQQRSLEQTIAYEEVPRKDKYNTDEALMIRAEQEIRISVQKTLDKCAEHITRLERRQAGEVLQAGANQLNAYHERMASILSAENTDVLLNFAEPLVANLEFCESLIADFSVRWDDAWARLKAMSTALGRQVPTAAGVFAPGVELFTPSSLDDRIDALCGRLRDMYVQLGMCTESIDAYQNVIRELRDRLEAERLQLEAEEKKSSSPKSKLLAFEALESIKETDI